MVSSYIWYNLNIKIARTLTCDGDRRKELCELSDGPDMVKCIKYKTLQWAGHIVWMDNARIQKKYWMAHVVEEDLLEDHG
jgi:hypothetical protein